MQNSDQIDLSDVRLFDGDDVDGCGAPAPDGTALTPAEIAAVRASQAAAGPSAGTAQAG